MILLELKDISFFSKIKCWPLGKDIENCADESTLKRPVNSGPVV